VSALVVRDVSCVFGGVRAVDGVTLDFRSGETHCVIGPNGAGKTTLINAISGHVRASSGSIELDGRPITRCGPTRAAREGVIRSFQTPSIFPDRSVEENLLIAARRPRGPQSSTTESIAAVLVATGLPRSTMGVELSHGQRKMLEVAAVLLAGPRVLLLDEPTAGLGVKETQEMADLVKLMAAATTTVIVEHDMAFVTYVADRVTVLNQGRVFSQGTPDQVRSDPAVQELYLGQRRADA
jgi:ABC-type branched-subunit amino acid transport system ATPase component